MPPIKIYTNENIPIAVSEGLKRRDIEAFSARDHGNLGLSDEEHLKWAAKNKASILTHDDDLLRISSDWQKEGKEHWGIIYISRKKFSIGECIRKVELLVSVLDTEDMKNHIEFL